MNVLFPKYLCWNENNTLKSQLRMAAKPFFLLVIWWKFVDGFLKTHGEWYQKLQPSEQTQNFILIVVNFVVTIIINIFTFREIGEACGIILEIKWSLYLYFVIQRNLCKMKFLRFHFQGIYIYKVKSKFTQLSLDQRMNSIMENCNTFTLFHPRTEEKKIRNFSQ